MKYYILNGTFRPDRPQGPAFREALEAHHAYVRKYVEDGVVLAAGPKPKGSGIILLKAEDEDWVRAFCAGDPFVQAGVQDYEIIEFKYFTGNACAADWFGGAGQE